MFCIISEVCIFFLNVNKLQKLINEMKWKNTILHESNVKEE